MPLTIPVNGQIKLETYLIYTCSHTIWVRHTQSIYSKHPYIYVKENQNPIQMTASVGYIQQVLLQIESN